MSVKPPRLAKFLLTLTSRGPDRSFVTEDLQEEFDAIVAEGMSAREARRWYWRQVLGSVRPLLGSSRAERGSREARAIRSLQTLLMDVRVAGRGLLRTPGQTVAAIITLGLGIGITTAMFSVVYGAFYRALPFENAERLVSVWQTSLRSEQLRVSFYDFVEWRESQRSFTDLAAQYTTTVGLRGSERAIQLDAAFVSWDALQTLGAQPALGRNFLEEDDESGAPLVAIVSHRAWEERLGGDVGIVGQEAVINAEPATIIGVMPDGFHFPFSQDIWLPLRLDATRVERGQGPSLQVFGHLREGVTLDQANAEMDALAQRIAIDRPDTNDGVGASVRPYNDLANAGPALLINTMLMLSALTVLLIACINVANLLLARAAMRTREIALRAAMGARRLQLMILMLAESSTLAVVGALLGTGVAWLALVGVRYLQAGTDAPYWMEFKLDPPALFFTAGAAAFAGIVAGLIPAIKATKGDLTVFLKDGSRGATGLQIGRLSRFLVTVEVAFSACLLIVAGLIATAMNDLASFDYPFVEQGVLTAGIRLFDSTDPDEESRRQLFDQVLERLGEVPRVEAAALTSTLPGLQAPQIEFGIEGRTYRSEQNYPLARSTVVSPGFFAFLGVEPVRGRVFSSLDRADGQAVSIVNQSFARRHFPDEDPVGQQIRSVRSDSTLHWRMIVGVVPDLAMEGVSDVETTDGSGFYVPLAQADNQSVRLLIRSQGAPLELTDGVRDLIRSIDPDLAIFGVSTLSGAIRAVNWPIRVVGALYIVFGAAALFLASVGLFGVVSFGAERRTQEVGVRMAVGARAGDVVRLIVGQDLKYILMGLAVGVGLARLMAGVIFPTYARDLPVYVVILGLILLVAVLASLVPAMRAARLDPVRALQSQ